MPHTGIKYKIGDYSHKWVKMQKAFDATPTRVETLT